MMKYLTPFLPISIHRFQKNIEANKIVFLCIQIQCASTWGLIPKIISTLTSLKLEVIDNRSWHPRGVDTTLMTEIFVEDDCFLHCSDEEAHVKSIDDRIEEVTATMTKSIRQPGAKVKVTRWYPGVLQAIVEEVKSKSSTTSKNVTGMAGMKSVRDIVAGEATKVLESKRNVQILATAEKSLDEIKKEMGIPIEHTTQVIAEPEPAAPQVTDLSTAGALPPPTTTRRRVRQKMRSTPVTGGSLFDSPKQLQPEAPKDQGGRHTVAEPFRASLGGQSAELVVGGEVFKIRVMPETVHRIRSGYSGELLDDSNVKFAQEDVPIEHRLQGFVRTSGLLTISEDTTETDSNVGSAKEGSEKDSEAW
jgi:hypothetical protein